MDFLDEIFTMDEQCVSSGRVLGLIDNEVKARKDAYQFVCLRIDGDKLFVL